MRTLETILDNSYIQSTYTLALDNATTGLDIITPTSGSSIKVVGYFISTAAVGSVKLKFNTSADTVGSIQSVAAGTTTMGYVPCNITGAIDEPLTLVSTVTDQSAVFVSVNYQEV